jgi:long-subunit acyl-CoA synthetase (AMP-forming)
VLPLSTLLENLAGVYAPLLSGATVIVPSLNDVGLTGSSQLDVEQLLACITQHEPNSLIFVPEILRAITVATECGWRPPSSLHFVAVGGGKVAPESLHRAHQAGLPAFEGYGLSECASVVTLNTPKSNRVGAVGRPLPHVDVQIENGEIVVTGSSFLGYVGQPDTWQSAPVRTGDIGHIDVDGFVYVNGRAKNQLITSYGRNISPEWVESELLAGPLLSHAIVIGEARPFCTALVVAQQDSTTDEEISAWIRTANQQLPDYARVVDWQRMPAAAINKGGADRAGIEIQHHLIIEQMYASKQEVSNQ